jgi:4-amino-4-deoxy-L-arabinose transferase-like glycosyltransferase
MPQHVPTEVPASATAATATASTRRARVLASARARTGAVPGPVWAISAAYLALLVCYSLLYPVYLGFDEPQHVDMVIALRHHPFDWPGPGERGLSAAMSRSQGIVYGRARPRLTGSYLASEIPPRPDRKTIQALGDNTQSPLPPPDSPLSAPGGFPNQMVQHPPLYYAIGAATLDLLPYSESLAYDQVVSILRLLSVLMIAPLPLLAWATTKRLVGTGPIATAAAALPLAVPALARGAGNVQNDNLLVLAVAVLTYFLVRVMTGDLSRRTAVGAGLAMTFALLSKGTALPLIPLLPLAYAIAWWRERGPIPWRPALVAGLLSGIGMLWWLRNLVVYGAVQVNGFGAHFPRYEARLNITPGPHDSHVWWVRFKAWYESRFWSGLGLLDQNGLPPRMIHALSLLALIGIVLALVRGCGRGRFGERLALGALVIPVSLLTVLIASYTRSYFMRTGVSAAIQGRYAFPAIPALCVVVAIGYGRVAGRVVKFLPVAALLGALLVQAVAVRGLMTGMWLPAPWTGGGRFERYRVALSNIAAWSPWPVGVTYAAFFLAAALALVAVGVSVRGPVRQWRSRATAAA